jgi:DNA helicase-2/ATP-dependent DNA helicase PcrA
MRALDAAGETPAVILEKILDSTGYLAGLRASTDPQDASRVENLAELVSVAEDFANEGSVDAADLGAFLERIALVADADQIPGEAERRGQVTLMTVHTAKGLEFPYVFVTGLEDGTFPHKRSMDDESELAEERRLAYVALTRAQKQLYLTRAATRSAWGSVEHMPPSRFLDDLPAEAVEVRSESRQEKMWKSAHERARQRSFEASDWGGYGDDDGGPVIGSGAFKVVGSRRWIGGSREVAAQVSVAGPHGGRGEFRSGRGSFSGAGAARARHRRVSRLGRIRGGSIQRIPSLAEVPGRRRIG